MSSRGRRVLILLIGVILVLYVINHQHRSKQSLNPLVVYTYSSFVNAWGAGPEIAKRFKEKTGIDVEFVDVGEAGLLIQRLKLEAEHARADVLLGMNQYDAQMAMEQLHFHKIAPLKFELYPSLKQDQVFMGPFVACDWSPMTLIYRKSDHNIIPKKLIDLMRPEFKGKITILDPRTSSPGYIVFDWILEKLGEHGTQKFFSQIKSHIVIAPSWTAGYGLFKSKQTQFIFSYLTSPAYHWIEEKNMDYKPVYLDEQLPYQMEYAAVMQGSKHKDLATQFVHFLLLPETQKILMTKNYMLPVRSGVVDGTPFENLKSVQLFFPTIKISREKTLEVWKSLVW